MIRTLQDYRKAGFGGQFAWLDFVNSQERDGFGRLTDHLDNPNWLANFLRHFHLADPLPPAPPLRELADFREFLRGIAEHLAARPIPTACDVRTLNTTLLLPTRANLSHHPNAF